MSRLTVSLVFAVLVPIACSHNDEKALTRDTALARDLSAASADTSMYSDAADVAMRDLPDSELAPATSRQAAAKRASAPTPVNAPNDQGATGCESPASADQRRCLMGYLAHSDQALNRTYQSLVAELAHRPNGEGSAPATVEELRTAQRAWLVYRDTECRRRNRGQEGPLWAPTRARCLGAFSQVREQELAAQLKKVGGTE